MSRQAPPKSRGDKGGSRGGAPSVATQPGPVPTVTSDVVPGRLSNEAWQKINSNEEDNEFIGTLVEEILDATMDECYKKYISKQVLPYTVYHAKDNIMKIIEWSFLPRDYGEDMSQGTGWIEESEPDPGVIDSWAQGSVPVILEEVERPITPTPIPEESLESENLEEDEMINLEKITPEPVEEKLIEPEPQTEIEKQKEIIKNQGPKKIKYKKHTGRLKSAGLSDMTKSLLQSESEIFEKEFASLRSKSDLNSDSAHLSPSQKSLLKLQAGRPPGNKEVTFDERGNVVGVMRLDVRSLPSHKIKVQYDIIDPEAEAAAQRLALMRTGKLRKPAKPPKSNKLSPRSLAPLHEYSRQVTVPTTAIRPTPPTASTYMGRSQEKERRMQMSSFLRRQYQTNARIEPLPPPLIDTIDASPGVKITEGNMTKTASQMVAVPTQKPSPTCQQRENSMLAAIGISPRRSGRTLRALGSTTAPHMKTDGKNFLRPVLSPSDVTMKNMIYVQPPYASPLGTNVQSPSVATN